MQCPMCLKPATWIGNPYRPFCTERCKGKEEQSGIAIWVATCAGVGYFPFAPGTAGSAVALVVVAALSLIPFANPWPTVILAALTGTTLGLGVWAGTIAERFFKRTDPSTVVIDEVVGQSITFLGLPQALWAPSSLLARFGSTVQLPHPPWKLLAAGFLLFRFFDILKPYPAGRAEKVSGGWGIMLDDVVAGFYALVGVLLLGLVLK